MSEKEKKASSSKAKTWAAVWRVRKNRYSKALLKD